jgi:hypothetical protein
VSPSRPDAPGHFGPYGGRFVPETLMPALDELEAAWLAAREDPAFAAELRDLLVRFAGRPTPLGDALRMGADVGGCRVLLKREDLCHTGAHKINNTLGQVLLARRMGKRRIIAETGAGQHGVATATAAALFGLPCDVFMGALDVERQALNVFRMQLLGARVIPVQSGSRTLKDAMNEAIRDWVTHVRDTHYIIGSVAGPHPYPAMVRDFQSVIGTEAREQVLAQAPRVPRPPRSSQQARRSRQAPTAAPASRRSTPQRRRTPRQRPHALPTTLPRGRPSASPARERRIGHAPRIAPRGPLANPGRYRFRPCSETNQSGSHATRTTSRQPCLPRC